jgi:hypothetical protein
LKARGEEEKGGKKRGKGRDREEEEVSLGVIMTNIEIFHIFTIQLTFLL